MSARRYFAYPGSPVPLASTRKGWIVVMTASIAAGAAVGAVIGWRLGR